MMSESWIFLITRTLLGNLFQVRRWLAGSWMVLQGRRKEMVNKVVDNNTINSVLGPFFISHSSEAVEPTV